MTEYFPIEMIVQSLGQPKRRVPARPGLRLRKATKIESFDAGVDQERLQAIVEQILTLPTGKRLLKETSPYCLQGRLDPNLESQGVLQSDQAIAKPLMSLTDKSSNDMLAVFAVHELAHLKQMINMRNHLGTPHYFRGSARTIADVVVPELLEETDAVVNEVVAAYELNQRRIPGPWAFTCFYEPYLATALTNQIAAGHSPRSREARAAVADAWMVHPQSSRMTYEARFLGRSMENQQSRYPALASAMRGFLPNRGEVTHDEFDLHEIARDQNGTSYFELMDLRKSDYLGLAGRVSSMAELSSLIRKTLEARQVEMLFTRSENLVSLLEDQVYGIFAWTQLPAYYNSASTIKGVVSGGFQDELEAVGIVSGRSRQDRPELKQRAETIFDRCEAVAKEASLLAQPLRDAVAMGRKEMAESSSWIITRNMGRAASLLY